MNGPGDKEPAKRICNSFTFYQENFKNVQNEKAIIDVSPSYFFFAKTSIKEIKKYLGSNVKIIILLRDPIERAFSNYLHKLRLFHEFLPFDEAIEIEQQRIDEGYGDFWFYKEHSLYFEKLSLFFSEFGPEQVKVILFEELKTDPLSVCQELFKFVGVDDTFSPGNTSTVFNKGALYEEGPLTQFLVRPHQSVNKVKSTLKKILPSPITSFLKGQERRLLNSRKIDKPVMTNSAIETLGSFFKDDVSSLKKEFDINVTTWKYFMNI